MTAQGVHSVVGAPVDRVDGQLKVSGRATYPTDVDLPGMVYAALIRSTTARGTVVRIDTSDAIRLPGVLSIITPVDAPRIHKGKRDMMTPPPEPPLQGPRIDHFGQYLAVVVAETAQQAADAARLVAVTVDDGEALLSESDPRAKVRSNPYLLDMKRGDVERALVTAPVVVGADYLTSDLAHSPIGLFATVAAWSEDRLTVHDSTQYPYLVRDVLATSFHIPKDHVRVIVPFVGGAFGAGLRVSPHTIIAAMAARVVGRPVKIVLTRPQMFTGLGHRPRTSQRIRVGAERDGTIVAIDHEGTSIASRGASLLFPIPMGSISAYACPNVSARDKRVQLDIPPVAHMRAPGEAEGNFALESALDELAWSLELDPIDLRRRNHADVHPQTGLAWSSKALLACYETGAERFGWSRRTQAVGSMRDGPWVIGYGMAGVSYGHHQVECSARVTVRRDGTLIVASGTTEIGVGTLTVMTQLAAEALAWPLDRVEARVGDTELPRAPYVGGSGLTVALGTAIDDACRNLVTAVLEQAGADPESPLAGCEPGEVMALDRSIVQTADPSAGEPIVDVLRRHGLDELSADGASTPPPGEIGVQVKSLIASRAPRLGRGLVAMSGAPVPAGAFGAKFVEVRIDPELGLLRIARVVSAIDAGRVVNEKTARSQIIGGTVQAIGMAMFESIATDATTGRVANATFGDYLIPVNADIPDMEVVFVGEPDRNNSIGVKGVGEIGYVGIPAAISNAIYHAIGRRPRSLPITIDQLLETEGAS